MNKAVLGTLMSIAMLATATAAVAAPKKSLGNSRNEVGFVGELDLEFGGDEVAQVSFVDGSTQKVRAGQGVALNGGVHFRPADWPVDFAGTIGYKYVTTKASNADINIGRVEFKLLATFDPVDAWWVGAGPVWHTGTKYDGDGFTRDVKFDDSVGFTLRAGWKWVGLSYTNIEYQVQNSRTKVDASSFGLFGWWRF